MNRIASTVAAGLLLALTAGCSDRGTGLEKSDEVAGAYRYTAYDSSGAVVVRGTLRLQQPGGGVTLKGTWDLEATGDPALVGPQDGEGELRGTLQRGDDGSSELHLDLNPNLADNNVFLDAAVLSSGFQGHWHYSTLIGERGRGVFEAHRR